MPPSAPVLSLPPLDEVAPPLKPLLVLDPHAPRSAATERTAAHA
jgi:hypothetical protein